MKTQTRNTGRSATEEALRQDEDGNKHFVSNGSTKNQSNYYLRSRPTTRDAQSWAEASYGYEEDE